MQDIVIFSHRTVAASPSAIAPPLAATTAAASPPSPPPPWRQVCLTKKYLVTVPISVSIINGSSAGGNGGGGIAPVTATAATPGMFDQKILSYGTQVIHLSRNWYIRYITTSFPPVVRWYHLGSPQWSHQVHKLDLSGPNFIHNKFGVGIVPPYRFFYLGIHRQKRTTSQIFGF